MRRRLALAIILAVCTTTSAQSPQLASFGSSTLWSIPDETFGGWSGIEVDENGEGFIAISDRGLITSGRLLRNSKGWIVGVEPGPILTINGTDGAPLARYFDDSEGLAIAPDGTVYISFESEHRVMSFPDATADMGTDLPRADGFADMQNNSSLEALAIDAEGALYTMPERSGKLSRPFDVYRFKDGEWTIPFTIERRGDFLPTGADIGPDGRFYLLERALSESQLGFATRVRRFDMTEEGITNEVTLLTTEPRMHDNLEGISVWQDALGDMHLTMISDDNHKFFQVNEIVEYVVRVDAGLDRATKTD